MVADPEQYREREEIGAKFRIGNGTSGGDQRKMADACSRDVRSRIGGKPVLLGLVERVIGRFDNCPWATVAGDIPISSHDPPCRRPIYSAEERKRRDATVWTLVQGWLAPIQFLVFIVSLCLVLHYFATGGGLALATGSVVVKTLILYSIMVTGCVWEREVFGVYLFARAFFWEDVGSVIVLVLHSSYIVALRAGYLSAGELLMLALAAYAAYIVNAGQFVLKLRAARREAEDFSRDPALGLRASG
jgi:3-vinyl bacteriochlorophyllide hydratase